MSHTLLGLIGKSLRTLPNFRGKDYLTKNLIRPFTQNQAIEVVVDLNPECRLICNLDDWIPWNVFVHGKYIAEANYEKFMLKKASKANIIFDVGANIGYYTIQFSSVSNGRVFAFEPMDYQHSILLRNLELNEISNVIPTKQIVSDQHDLMRIYQNSLGNTGASSIHKETDRYEDIPSTTLDSFCEQHDVTDIDLVKIDVEGHEFAVLKGMSGMLKQKKVKNLFVEICNEHLVKAGTSSGEIIQYLESFGYRAYSVKSGQVEAYQEDDGDESLVYFTVDQ